MDPNYGWLPQDQYPLTPSMDGYISNNFRRPRDGWFQEDQFQWTQRMDVSFRTNVHVSKVWMVPPGPISVDLSMDSYIRTNFRGLQVWMVPNFANFYSISNKTFMSSCKIWIRLILSHHVFLFYLHAFFRLGLVIERLMVRNKALHG